MTQEEAASHMPIFKIADRWNIVIERNGRGTVSNMLSHFASNAFVVYYCFFIIVIFLLVLFSHYKIYIYMYVYVYT